jgi:hypothetical protein
VILAARAGIAYVGDTYQIAAELIVPLNGKPDRNEAVAVYERCRAEPFRQARFQWLDINLAISLGSGGSLW